MTRLLASSCNDLSSASSTSTQPLQRALPSVATVEMGDLLAKSIAKLDINAAPRDTEDDTWIDSILDHAPPRKRVRQDPDELRFQLEQKYLAPSTSFSQAWLNRLQQ